MRGAERRLCRVVLQRPAISCVDAAATDRQNFTKFMCKLYILYRSAISIVIATATTVVDDS